MATLEFQKRDDDAWESSPITINSDRFALHMEYADGTDLTYNRVSIARSASGANHIVVAIINGASNVIDTTITGGVPGLSIKIISVSQPASCEII